MNPLNSIRYICVVTLRFRYWTGVGFDKIFVFCNKFCIRSGKCVFIVVKTKCVNSGNINGICGKLNFTTKYTCFTINDINFIKKHRHRTIFDASGKTVS